MPFILNVQKKQIYGGLRLAKERKNGGWHLMDVGFER